jgi:hypothetical protein
MSRGLTVPTDTILSALYLTHALGILVGAVSVAAPLRDPGDVVFGGFLVLLALAMTLALWRYRSGRYDARRLVAPGPAIGVRRRCREASELLRGDGDDQGHD